jgi:hypothetical protein
MGELETVLFLTVTPFKVGDRLVAVADVRWNMPDCSSAAISVVASLSSTTAQ